ncbi:electron transfer flavoprotein, beta subunit [Desulfosporosinus orientis DSM 765]|uniref:Electron transfer flavoprotein small subunit n=1 Tax=Desulfosporosinus orientis (strain ATCC 19365 / DSM 765 / NCIMB 8382 / VKM B-1628 / Singapore I) TaxID=768706 RepID=G7WIB6_DESOD|nr:electron transfer flavoprotein subunit beta/FixA family protein [Desulfosporosinus orientis]AET68564.1 electron transfer flavoprotein, beta subunit [Desulfosporosinus orientis DSM 765]
MRIIVCIKQVPDTHEVKIDPKTGTLIRSGVPSIINPEDRHALETALILKDQHGAEVVVLSMGPPQAADALLEALAMGADQAILLSDRAFAGADTAATSYALSQAIGKIGDIDMIFAGRQAIDGDTAQVGPQIAELLCLPQATYVQNVTLLDDKTCRVERAIEDGHEIVDIQLPALFTVLKAPDSPRYPSIRGIMRANEQGILIWGAEDVNADYNYLGLKGSPTQVRRTFVPEQKRTCTILEGSNTEKCQKLIECFKECQLLNLVVSNAAK